MYKFYKINSPFPRHKKYISIFNYYTDKGLSFIEYTDTITHFILDKKLSSNNNDDVECFRHLVFDSMFGNLHILYICVVCGIIFN